MGAAEDYRARIESILVALRIPQELIAGRALPLQVEAAELVVAEIGRDGREHRLIPPAADAWRAMRAAARAEGVELECVSAFRGVDRQAEIVREKLLRGQSSEQILEVSAPPGYSEHHTGCAIDVGTPDSQALEQTFEQTRAFRWLSGNAGLFSFHLSFPKGNRYGYAFEPWHWCYRTETA